MSFPFTLNEEKLTNHDFVRFELQFLSSALELLPCHTIHFLPVDASTKAVDIKEENEEIPEVWKVGENMVKKQLQPVVDPDKDLLFLPVWNSITDLAAVAVLSAGSKGLYGDFSAEWLMERSRLLSREYRRIKHWAYDSVSGLLSGAHLHSELEVLSRLFEHVQSNPGGEEKEGDWHLILVEVGFRASDADKLVQEIGRIAAYLDSLVGEASVYHLGVGVFGLLWNSEGSMDVSRLGYGLLRKLKRQKIQKVHIGVSHLINAVSPGEQQSSENAKRVLSEAWTALSKARERGIYALCSFEDIQQQNHPFGPLPAEVTGQLKKRWRRCNQFSVVVIAQDIILGKTFPKRVKSLVGEAGQLYDIDTGKIVVFLPEYDESKTEEWCQDLQYKADGLGNGSFSFGIAFYPCPGFSKNDLPVNALKALYHTNFLGKGTITKFSGVSLNLSGDVYYNEGNLLGAIKEYRLGLNLDPDNTNLINSLGVIYAQLDKRKKAAELFEKALASQPKDFMALVNLGFVLQAMGDNDNAVRNFEKAYKINNSYFDLLLQLGQLYCQEKKYKKAIKVLQKAEKSFTAKPEVSDDNPWQKSEPWLHAENDLGHGLVYMFLGEAFKEMGNNKDAMTYLQRAISYNSRDAKSLSMLAELYIKEKQGKDIALSLCDQALAIDDKKDVYWYRKGFVLHARKEIGQAREALLRCLELNKKNLLALSLLAQIYQKEKQLPLARKVYLRILKLDGTNKRAVNALKKLTVTR